MRTTCSVCFFQKRSPKIQDTIVSEINVKWAWISFLFESRVVKTTRRRHWSVRWKSRQWMMIKYTMGHEKLNDDINKCDSIALVVIILLGHRGEWIHKKLFRYQKHDVALIVRSKILKWKISYGRYQFFDDFNVPCVCSLNDANSRFLLVVDFVRLHKLEFTSQQLSSLLMSYIVQRAAHKPI